MLILIRLALCWRWSAFESISACILLSYNSNKKGAEQIKKINLSLRKRIWRLFRSNALSTNGMEKIHENYVKILLARLNYSFRFIFLISNLEN